MIGQQEGFEPMSLKCSPCNYHTYDDHKFCPLCGLALVQQIDGPFLCREVWVKSDSGKVLHCRLPQDHKGNCQGDQIGSAGKRWPRSEWPESVRSGRCV